MQQRRPDPIDSENNLADHADKSQIVLNARQQLMEWEAEQEYREKFQQARELILGHSGTHSLHHSSADSQEACCANCAEHDHRVRTRYAAHLAAMHDDSDDTD
jgi:hypothetical protein